MTRQIVILGGGPAGLSGALWLKNLGLAPFVCEAAERLGGMQNLNFLANEWVLGQMDVTGPQLAARFAEHVRRVGVTVWLGRRLVGLSGCLGGFALRLADAQGRIREETCAAVLLATGTRYRAEDVLARVPGFSAAAGHVVYGPHAFVDLTACAGRRILIVGGGDNAFENARLLVEAGARVDMALRSPPRAQRHLREEVAAAERAGFCRVHHGARLARLYRAAGAVGAELETSAGPVALEVARIHVLAGYEPNLDFWAALSPELQAGLARDASGYLVADVAGRTGVPGLYAAGDLCNPAFPSVVSALAQGAAAAKAIEFDLRNLP